RLYGPFVLVPGIINTVGFTVGAQPRMLDRPVALVLGSLAAFALPLALEALGWLGTTWEVSNGHIIMSSTGVVLDGAPAVALLIAAHAALIFVNALFGRSISAAR